MTVPSPPRLPAAFSHLDDRPVFLYVKVPVSRHSMDPLHLREDQIDQALRALGVGMVVGWGDSLGDARADGRRRPAFIRIDITAPSQDAARVALRTLLPTLSTPTDTQIHYTQDDRLYMDVLTETGWQLALLAPGPHKAGEP